MKRPISLIVVALLFLLCAVTEGWNIASTLYHGNGLLLDFFFPINLFIGVGLLQLKPSSRYYALGLIGLWMAFAGGFSIWALFNLDSVFVRFAPLGILNDTQQDHPPASPIEVVAMLLLFLVPAIWMLWVLLRRNVRELFKHKANSQMSPASM